MVDFKIRSGAQTGADRGALDAGLAAGVQIGGWCPKGRKSEDGVIPECYPLKETPSAEYPQRTEWNVRDSDGTVIFFFGPELGRGSSLTAKYARKHKKPMCLVDLARSSDDDVVKAVIAFLKDSGINTLNVAGSRESKAPGIQERVMTVVLKILAEEK